jgi:hypothetical protein
MREGGGEKHYQSTETFLLSNPQPTFSPLARHLRRPHSRNPGDDRPSERELQQELLPKTACSKGVENASASLSNDAPVVLFSTSKPSSSSSSFPGPAGRGLQDLRLPGALRLPVRRALGRGDPEDREGRR